MTDEPMVALRQAMAVADGPRIVALVPRVVELDRLQLAGDALLVALDEQVPAAIEEAAALAERLRARAWEGDDELADHLMLAAGTAVPAGRPMATLPVDLDELAMILEGDPLHGGGRIDRQSGEVWPQPAIDYAIETGEEDPEADDDPDRWLYVECEGSRAGYRDMERFIAELDDERKADRLWRAIGGRGAFRRFKDVLSEWPDDLHRWFGFADERQRGRARAWLVDAGYRAVPTPLARPDDG